MRPASSFLFIQLSNSRELQNSGESGQTDSGLIAAIITERNTLRQDTSGVIFKDIRNCRRFFMRRKFLAINLF